MGHQYAKEHGGVAAAIRCFVPLRDRACLAWSPSGRAAARSARPPTPTRGERNSQRAHALNCSTLASVPARGPHQVLRRPRSRHSRGCIADGRGMARVALGHRTKPSPSRVHPVERLRQFPEARGALPPAIILFVCSVRRVACHYAARAEYFG